MTKVKKNEKDVESKDKPLDSTVVDLTTKKVKSTRDGIKRLVITCGDARKVVMVETNSSDLEVIAGVDVIDVAKLGRIHSYYTTTYKDGSTW